VEKCIKQLEEEEEIHYEFVYIDDERGSYKAEYEPKIQKPIDFSKRNMIERIMESEIFLGKIFNFSCMKKFINFL